MFIFRDELELDLRQLHHISFAEILRYDSYLIELIFTDILKNPTSRTGTKLRGGVRPVSEVEVLLADFMDIFILANGGKKTDLPKRNYLPASAITQVLALTAEEADKKLAFSIGGKSEDEIRRINKENIHLLTQAIIDGDNKIAAAGN